MHGSIQREHTSCRSSRSSCSLHMRSVLPLVTKKNTLVIKANRNSSIISTATTSTGDSFLKDGRKICVGDCALFKPTQDSPPYIALIRQIKFTENDHLHLGVNWLYRPGEIKLGKGLVVEGAPNEVFYSFHEDEIPAESLLHPCKVAFLPKGVELPAGASSFVCRRVYDITNKCLWWLTDQDYVNDRQEEVDQLLNRSRLEMHASLQSGGRSPKQSNGPTSTSQVKPASDSGHNTGVIPSRSQVKGKKRERGDHGGEQVKRERCSRSDDSGSTHCHPESNLKSEIARITERGLLDLEGVERLVQLMQHDRTERKMDLSYRSTLAGVMAGTDKTECLDRFVQLRGLPVFDEWLQDVHKGKTGDKDSEVSVDEFVLVLLRALDKLPVDLQALQMCNIGRSVNHLRTHKNSEIQRKARSLVDTWKKRVEAEMITNEAISRSTQSMPVWPSKSRISEPSHSGVRTPTGTDTAIKSSVTQSTLSKTTSARFSHVDSNTKSTTSSPGHAKPASSPSSGKENLLRVPIVGSSDAPIVREDRSSSSNQSHGQSQFSSGKEEAKSAPGLGAANKMSVMCSRNRKGGLSGIQKEINSGRSSSVIKSTPLEKLSHSASSVEKVLDVTMTEGSSHKLIVKIPNRMRSPVRGVACASQDEITSTSSQISSPVLADRPEHFDHTSVEKTDIQFRNVVSGNNVDSERKNDTKGIETVPAETSVSPAALPDEGKGMTAESEKLNEVHLKSIKLHTSSFSPMNVLMRCVNYSEANSSLSLEDDVGMNLLASVAAGEISKSELLSPTESTERSMPTSKDICLDDEAKSKSIPENNATALQSQTSDDAECDTTKPAVVCGAPCSEGLSLSKDTPNELLDSKPVTSHPSEDFPISDDKLVDPSNSDAIRKVDTKWENSEKSNKNACKTSAIRTISADADNLKEKYTPCDNGTKGVIDFKINGVDTISGEKTSFNRLKETGCKAIIEVTASNPFSENDRKEVVIEDGRQDANEKPALCATSGNGFVESSEALPSTRPSEGDAKVEFDLNEGLIADEGKYGEPVNLMPSVAAAAKGPFVPPDDLLRSKGELGWRGSAATSAFRPAEPRKVSGAPLVAASLSIPDNSSSRHDRITIDIDLNVPDESALEEMAFQDAFVVKTGFSSGHCKFLNEPSITGSLREAGGLDLDLNRVDGASDIGNCSTNKHHKNETSSVQPKRFDGLLSAGGRKDLDLNDRPGAVDANANADQVSIRQQVKVGIPSQLFSAGLRMNSPTQGSFSSWFPSGNSFSAIAVPSMFPDRGEHPFPVFPPNAAQRTFSPSGVTPFTPEIYQGSVLSSSPAVPFPSSTFQLPLFPYGETYPLPSATFSMGATPYVDPSSGSRLFGPPAVHSQLLGAVGSVVPQFQRPYMVTFPENNTSGSFDSNKRWARQGFDLNTGPGAVESDVREGTFPISSDQNSVSSSKALPEEQARMYSFSTGMMKRKEPEGGLDSESFRFKQSSWQ